MLYVYALTRVQRGRPLCLSLRKRQTKKSLFDKEFCGRKIRKTTTVHAVKIHIRNMYDENVYRRYSRYGNGSLHIGL